MLNSNTSSTCPYNRAYGQLWPTNGWDLLATLGHPSKFQRVSRFGSVTAPRHCSSGRQPNFAALKGGRHLYSAGRPSRALAHILVAFNSAPFALHLCVINADSNYKQQSQLRSKRRDHHIVEQYNDWYSALDGCTVRVRTVKGATTGPAGSRQ